MILTALINAVGWSPSQQLHVYTGIGKDVYICTLLDLFLSIVHSSYCPAAENVRSGTVGKAKQEISAYSYPHIYLRSPTTYQNSKNKGNP